MFVELHAQSAFTFLDGAEQPETLANEAARLGMPAVALVDRDGVYGAARFHRAAEHAGVRALIGSELTLADGARLPVLVEDGDGYRNLCRLITRLKLGAPKGAGRVTLEDLEPYAGGLVCLTGGRHGPLAGDVARGDREGARRTLDRLAGIFGRDNCFVEVQRQLTRAQERDLTRLVMLAGAARLPLVASNQPLYARPGGRAVTDVFTCIREKTDLDHAGRRLTENGERDLKGGLEMAQRFRDLPEALANTGELAMRLAFTLKNLGYRFPEFPLPPATGALEHLRELAHAGARRRYGDGPLAARARRQIAHELEIIGAGANQFPIAVVPFRAEAGIAQPLTPVIAADLAHSGVFRTVDAGGLNPPPYEPQDINWATWRTRGADALVIGSVAPLPDGRFEVRFRLMDTAKQAQLAGFAYVASASQLRYTAHRIADVIYEKLTGDKGVFSTRITYVVKQGRRYELQVADVDGQGAQTILSSNEPIISPAWSPDGSQLAYVSFEQKKPVVYVQSLTTGQRRAVANFLGSNSAPAWSPDGKRLAVVLSKDGGSQIFLINTDGSGVTRLTQSSAIDTEPNFSPDGKLILFTSDRGGSPQIYGMSTSGGEVRRLTFEGTYNVSPRFSPDGKSFTFIQRNGARFNVATQDMATRQVQVLTDGTVDESPSFAPNGKMILYAAVVRGRGILSAVSSDGRVKLRIPADNGDAREPAWGPLPK